MQTAHFYCVSKEFKWVIKVQNICFMFTVLQFRRQSLTLHNDGQNLSPLVAGCSKVINTPVNMINKTPHQIHLIKYGSCNDVSSSVLENLSDDRTINLLFEWVGSQNCILYLGCFGPSLLESVVCLLLFSCLVAMLLWRNKLFISRPIQCARREATTCKCVMMFL